MNDWCTRCSQFDDDGKPGPCICAKLFGNRDTTLDVQPATPIQES